MEIRGRRSKCETPRGSSKVKVRPGCTILDAALSSLEEVPWNDGAFRYSTLLCGDKLTDRRPNSQN